MSTTTTNLGLVKPDLIDAADITAMNGNWDKIDTNLKNLDNHVNSKSNPHNVTLEQLTGKQLKFNNGYSSIYSANNWMEIFNCLVANDESNRCGIRLQSDALYLDDVLKVYQQVDNEKKFYTLFGSHNKPSGSYIGNGSATSRVIDVGGTGEVIVIYNSTHTALVTSTGGFAVFHGSDSWDVTPLKSSVYYRGGKLTISSDKSAVNHNGTEYYYQVL